MSPINVIAFSGSLRKGSYNRLLLQKLISLTPVEVTIDLFDISPIPLYNEDVEMSAYPEVVIDFKNRIRSADGVVIVTPEYNYSIPGVLKNALDWASRPPTDIPFIGKPGAILGTSISQFGSLRSQLHLRQVLFALGVRLMNTPEIYVPKAKELFVTGDLVDERTLSHLQKFWPAFINWVGQCH
jgi:chromate reductase